MKGLEGKRGLETGSANRHCPENLSLLVSGQKAGPPRRNKGDVQVVL